MHTLYTVHEKMDLHNFYYVCHIFTPQYLTICTIFAYSLLTEKAMENAVQGLGESVNMKIRWSLVKNHWKGRVTVCQ